MRVRSCRAWSGGGEKPFLLDNVRDLRGVLDWLCTQPNVDARRIGVTGVSLGGMHTWLCAALDTRVAAAAPMIGVQSFAWALDNDFFHGRVDSLRSAFAAICSASGQVRASLPALQRTHEDLRALQQFVSRRESYGAALDCHSCS